MTTFSEYADLPEDARDHLAVLEDFISDLDGKTIATPTGDNHFLDEGTIDAEDAVKAFNGIVAYLRR